MKLYELTKQDLENVEKLNRIEESIDTEVEKIRNKLYENEDKHALKLSSFRYEKIKYLYSNCGDWKKIIIMGFLPMIFGWSIKDTFCLALGSICSIGLIIFGLKCRTIRNRINNNLEKLSLELDELK